jgi:hypothetical protein
MPRKRMQKLRIPPAAIFGGESQAYRLNRLCSNAHPRASCRSPRRTSATPRLPQQVRTTTEGFTLDSRWASGR